MGENIKYHLNAWAAAIFCLSFYREQSIVDEDGWKYKIPSKYLSCIVILSFHWAALTDRDRVSPPLSGNNVRSILSGKNLGWRVTSSETPSPVSCYFGARTNISMAHYPHRCWHRGGRVTLLNIPSTHEFLLYNFYSSKTQVFHADRPKEPGKRAWQTWEWKSVFRLICLASDEFSMYSFTMNCIKYSRVCGYFHFSLYFFFIYRPIISNKSQLSSKIIPSLSFIISFGKSKLFSLFLNTEGCISFLNTF